jgi:hypothetical protein
MHHGGIYGLRDCSANLPAQILLPKQVILTCRLAGSVGNASMLLSVFYGKAGSHCAVNLLKEKMLLLLYFCC